jgi:REP-associated tyrosine transposase
VDVGGWLTSHSRFGAKNWVPQVSVLRPGIETDRTAHCMLVAMPARLVRYQQAGDNHFITFSCHRRQAYFVSPESGSLFESALERMRHRYRFVVFGYVVMPEHVHLLVNEPKRGRLDRAIQALKLSVVMHRRERPFWQARYYDFNVFTEAKRIEKLRYMHRNPVVRGLVARPEDWPWSSFRHYATGAEGTVEIESEWTGWQR